MAIGFVEISTAPVNGKQLALLVSSLLELYDFISLDNIYL